MRRMRNIKLATCFLAVLGSPVACGAHVTPGDNPKIIALLPAGFKGWACIDFGVAGAPPLPREGNDYIVRPRHDEVLKTSDTPGHYPRFYETWIEVGGDRRRLSDDSYLRKETSIANSERGVEHYCAFYGTEDEADAAPDPPGFEPSVNEAKGVSPVERQALIDLYKATGGEHWVHRVGWLGPPGTECKWHGIRCWSQYGGSPVVTGLDLYQNNLVGSIPQSLEQLSHLDELQIFGNRLSGTLPNKVIDRWLSGSLRVAAEAPNLTDVEEIEFERDPPALCGQIRTILLSDGRAAQFTNRCRNATAEDRTTFCEVKAGKVWPGDFARLAWLFERNGFYKMEGSYSRSISDFTFEDTRVKRGGKKSEVENYASAGPYELWIIQSAIEGVASGIEWDKTTIQPKFPNWDQQPAIP